MRLLMSETNWNMAILAKTMRDAGFFVTGARDAAEVLEYARSGQQNAILLDTDLPDMTISEAVIALRHSQPKLPICVFSRRVDPEQRARLMRLGADDVADWPDVPRETVAQLRAYIRRAHGLPNPLVEREGVRVNLSWQNVDVGGDRLHLTRLEYELIEMLALRGGSLVTREQIMSQLYAWEDEPDPKIIDVYICRIRAKLETMGAPDDLIQTSFGQGYRLGLPATADARTVAA